MEKLGPWRHESAIKSISPRAPIFQLWFQLWAKFLVEASLGQGLNACIQKSSELIQSAYYLETEETSRKNS